MKIAPMVLMALVAAGCTTPREPGDLQAENARLTADLDSAQQKIVRLDGTVEELRQSNAALQYEKQARVAETTGVRHGARAFVQGQVQALRDFAQDRNLLDYVGGETIERAFREGENILLVDMQNTFASPGVLVGATARARTETRVAICVLRPKGETLVVVWMSALFDIPAGEPVQLTFDTPVTVQTGDLVGAYAPEALGIPFDKGTGDTRTLRGPIKVGQAIRTSALDGSQKRSYSFGAVGFLD